MIVQADFSNAVHVVAEYLRKHARDIVRDGAPAKIADAHDLSAVGLCADRIDASKNSTEFDAAYDEARRLGVCAFDADVSRVAQVAEALHL
jgi:hypothetical protein